MRAGRLHQRITFIEKVATTNDFGEEEYTWVNVTECHKVPAAVEPIGGKEYFEAKQINESISTKITIRYMSGLNSAMRINHGDDTYEILSPPINSGTRNRQLEIMCSLVNPDA